MADLNSTVPSSPAEDSGVSATGHNALAAGSPTGFLHEQSWATRNGFPLWLLAVIWVVLSFVLFHLGGTLLLIVYLLAVSEAPLDALDAELLMEHMDVIFWGNSLSQVLILGLATWYFAGLSASYSRAAFMRFRFNSHALPVIGQTAALIVLIQPLIWLLSWINTQIPFPESYMAFEEGQLEMLKSFLVSDHMVLLTLIHVGLVPSICEEVLYRGYVQRALELSWGPWAAIIVSGILFGLYHVRLTQVLPLAVIGMLLAWIVWRSGSIYPAMAGHFVNNGGTVLLASWYPDYALEQMDTGAFPPVWLLLLSLAGTIFLTHHIHKTTRRE